MEQKIAASAVTRQRHYGIDLLRIVSMFMVLVLHILRQGGILDAVELGESNFTAAWFLETCAFCAVNCYALISGYVGIDAKYRYSSLALLWLQVVLYLLLGNLMFACFCPGSVTIKTVIKSFFPFLRNHYWYFTAYCCLFLFIPLLNRAVHALSRKQAAAVCIFLFLIFSAARTLQRTEDVFHVGRGYSVHWLAMLYVIGGCVKKHDFFRKIPGWLLWVGYFACVGITLAVKIFITGTHIEIISGNISSNILLEYISPTVFLCSLCLLALCARHPQLPGFAKRGISVFAPVSFGVYILHTHPQVFDILLKDLFVPFASYSTGGLVGAVLLTAAAVYAACTAVDLLRIRLFKALRLRQRLQRLEEKLVGDLWEQKPAS